MRPYISASLSEHRCCSRVGADFFCRTAQNIPTNESNGAGLKFAPCAAFGGAGLRKSAFIPMYSSLVAFKFTLPGSFRPEKYHAIHFHASALLAKPEQECAFPRFQPMPFASLHEPFDRPGLDIEVKYDHFNLPSNALTVQVARPGAAPAPRSTSPAPARGAAAAPRRHPLRLAAYRCRGSNTSARENPAPCGCTVAG